MLKKRLIPCLFLKNGHLVRSEKFSYHQLLGDPLHQVERINSWSADELIYIDISDVKEYDLRRSDMKVKRMSDIYEIISEVSKTCFIPLSFGGNIKTLDEIREILKRGADKVVVNTIAIENPNFITEGAAKFGSQCIIVGIDVKKENGEYKVYSHHGKTLTDKNLVSWAKEVEHLGAGEIFLNSIDRDGTGMGYDTYLIKSVADAVKIPVIACGGVGVFEHFIEGFVDGNASAVAAGNIFNYTENSVIRAKKTLKKAGIEIRDIVKNPTKSLNNPKF
ncbi:MAG: imidazole glycerol phosphate synthase cyclase subunit [Nanoarchaeota archaeon]